MSIFTKKKQAESSIASVQNAFYINEVIPTITEQFKGQVVQDTVKYPKLLGVTQPFDYGVTEGLYKKFGFVTGIIDKYVDFIVSGFYARSKDDKSQAIIDQWMQDTDFDTILRQWVREALIKGNAFLEIAPDNQVKLLDAKYIWVKRNELGEVEGYNQYLGKAGMKINPKEVEFFEPKQIAHLTINKVGDSAYGLGVIFPAIDLINDFLCAQKEMHTLMKRKSNAPIVATLGDLEHNLMPTDEVVAAFGQKLEWLHNKHEWAIGAGIKLEALNFGNVGEKFAFILEHDTKMLFFAFQVPEVLMGAGSVPEGLAQVQMDAWQRNIASKQAEIEKVIEQKIFKSILQANNLDVHVEFEWGKPSDDEKNRRIDILLRLMSNPMITGEFVAMAQEDLAMQLGYDTERLKNEFELAKQERQAALNKIEREREEKESQPVVPGREEFYHYDEKKINEQADYTISEWIGFNYSRYLDKIIEAIENNSFDYLAATSELDLTLGYFSQEQISSLKQVLTEAFQEGRSIRDIAKMIKNEVDPSDLILLNKKDQISRVISASQRPIIIARTEVVRMSNLGAVQDYKDNGVEEFAWIAALSDRTCPECEELNGKIFDVNSGKQPPVHVCCRCTTKAVIRGLTNG